MVVPDPLDHREEQPRTQDLRVEVQVGAALVAVVEDRVLPQPAEQPGRQIEPRVQIGVIVLRDLQDRSTERAHGLRRGDGVAGTERHVLRIRDRRRPVPAPQRGRVQRDPHPLTGIGRRPAPDHPERSGDLRGPADLQPEQRTVEERVLVERVHRGGQRDVVDPGDPGALRAVPGRREVAQPGVPVGAGADQEHGGAVRRGDRVELRLAGLTQTRQHRREQHLRSSRGGGRIGAGHREGTDRRGAGRDRAL